LVTLYHFHLLLLLFTLCLHKLQKIENFIRIICLCDAVTFMYCVYMCSSSRMRYVAAYLLAVLGGNDKPSESDITKILSSVGIDADPTCLRKVIGELKDKNLDEVIAAGK